MAKGAQAHNLPADVAQLIDQLERHCLAPDGSYASKSSFADLQLAREEMLRERAKYLEAMAVYSEAVAMVEEYHQALSAANLGGVRDHQGVYPQLGLSCSPKIHECLEHRLAVAEAAQKLRLPLISEDGEIHEEEIEKMSRSSLDSTSTTTTLGSSSNSISYSSTYTSSSGGMVNAAPTPNCTDTIEPAVGGVPNRFLGVTPGFLWQVQQQQPVMDLDMTEYQRSLIREIESRLEAKCDTLADMFAMDEIDSSSLSQISSARLPERVKLIIEDIEKEEAILLEDLYSMDRKFAEHYNVLEQILAVLVKFVKDLKLQHQHQYDESRKTWLCKRCQTMNAKLRVLEHLLLRDTYTKDSVPALHRIRKYLLDATEEASIAYNKAGFKKTRMLADGELTLSMGMKTTASAVAVTRLREYQGVDPHFDTIARQYHEIVKKLEGMQWTIHQVEMDLKRTHEHATT